ncbi:hypothetical protein ACP4OV_030525 [Aristida adscensionis]
MRQREEEEGARLVPPAARAADGSPCKKGGGAARIGRWLSSLEAATFRARAVRCFLLGFVVLVALLVGARSWIGLDAVSN